MFNTFIFNVGPANCGKRFLFSFFNRSSLSSLVSISPVVAPYFFLALIFLSLTLFLSRPHSTLSTSSRCYAANVAWSFSLSLGGCGSVSNGGWLFWLLEVGWFWLMVVGWSSGMGSAVLFCGYGWVSLVLLPILVVVVDVVCVCVCVCGSSG